VLRREEVGVVGRLSVEAAPFCWAEPAYEELCSAGESERIAGADGERPCVEFGLDGVGRDMAGSTTSCGSRLSGQRGEVVATVLVDMLNTEMKISE
jgi:hypothetical protein